MLAHRYAQIAMYLGSLHSWWRSQHNDSLKREETQLHSKPEEVSEAQTESLQIHITAKDGALKSGGFSKMILLTRGSLTTLNPR